MARVVITGRVVAFDRASTPTTVLVRARVGDGPQGVLFPLPVGTKPAGYPAVGSTVRVTVDYTPG